MIARTCGLVNRKKKSPAAYATMVCKFNFGFFIKSFFDTSTPLPLNHEGWGFHLPLVICSLKLTRISGQIKRNRHCDQFLLVQYSFPAGLFLRRLPFAANRRNDGSVKKRSFPISTMPHPTFRPSTWSNPCDKLQS